MTPNDLLVDHVTSVLRGVLLKRDMLVEAHRVIYSPPKGILASIALRRACEQVSKTSLSTKLETINAYRDFTGVTFSHGPVDVVGQGEFAEVGKDLIANLEGGDVGCNTKHQRTVFKSYKF